MGNINIRTDLAVELNEAVDKSDSRYSGVIVREHIDKVSLVKVTTLEIINEEGEKLFNRKAGNLIKKINIAKIQFTAIRNEDSSTSICRKIQLHRLLSERRHDVSASPPPLSRSSTQFCSAKTF